MKKSMFFAAACTVLLFDVLMAFFYIVADYLGREQGNVQIASLMIRSNFVVFVVGGVISLFHRNAFISKGIVLGVLVAFFADFSLGDGLYFDVRNELSKNTMYGIILKTIIPITTLTTSIIFFVKRNFEMAKIFAFITVAIFASFFIGQLAKSLFLDPEDDHGYGFLIIINSSLS